MIRPILTWPDPVLSQVCATVGDVAEVQGLIRDLGETMYAAPGRGLAAPQVGEALRVFVMDTGWKEGPRDLRAFVNPVIVETSEERATGEEGCLSIPDLSAEVERFARIRLTWTDETGAAHDDWLEGIDAICAQHECDHLDGVVILDRLPPGARAASEVLLSGDRA